MNSSIWFWEIQSMVGHACGPYNARTPSLVLFRLIKKSKQLIYAEPGVFTFSCHDRHPIILTTRLCFQPMI